MNNMLFDCAVVGGGPAGLSASIYLGRFLRSTLIVDSGHGRSTFEEVNENYLGFPLGVQTQKLRKLGLRQAKRFGVKFKHDLITKVEKKDSNFLLTGKLTIYRARSIILATGVTDRFPHFKDIDEYVGVSLFWCITCDGYKVRDKHVVVIGNTDESACTAMQLLRYTPHVTFITNCPQKNVTIPKHWIKRLYKHNVRFICGELTRFIGNDGKIEEVIVDNVTRIKTEFVFSLQGARPNVDLALQLGINVSTDNYIQTDTEQRTNIPFVYAAGDVTRIFSHQVITAAHEGSMAAQAANYDLYDPEMKME